MTPLIWKAATADQCEAAYAPIGTRIGERSLQVRDLQLNLLPDGVSGELYLGGYGVARGYLNRPGMTAERFVPDPASRNGGRLYRSGDLVRQRESGVIDCLGRIDHQVKIRGFRIELGEVEAQLKRQAGVRDALVMAQDGDHGKVLVGYVVPESADQLAAALGRELKAALEVTLPGYMVPTQWVLLERFPLNPNGKIDRKALPLPDLEHGRSRYVAPVSDLQCTLAGIWQEVLKREQVGLDDNFFELGGHSLLATQATAQAQLELGGSLALELMFKASTLEAYAELVAGSLNTHLDQDLSDMHDFLAELESN